jgi:hypothetical protein
MAHPIQSAHSLFPSCLCSAVIQIVNLLDDAAVSPDGNAVYEVAYQVSCNKHIWTYIGSFQKFRNPFILLLLLYIVKSNPHPFYSIRGLKNQMWIRIACRLHSRSRAGFLKNDRTAVLAINTIIYLFFIILYDI